MLDTQAPSFVLFTNPSVYAMDMCMPFEYLS